MKSGIHPENYRLVAFKDMSNEDVFITKSTVDTKETIIRVYFPATGVVLNTIDILKLNSK